MKWASALSDDESLLKAFKSASREIRAQLGGRRADLVFAFVSPHHRSVWDALPRLLERDFPKAVRLGASGGGLIGGGREVESGPAFALTAARLPGIGLHPFYLPPGATSLAERLDATAEIVATILLPEPFSCDVETVLAEADAALPHAVLVGGCASGARQAGDNAILLGPDLHDGGAVGVALSGAIAVDTLVAQGCRPIGNPMFVTAAKGHLVLELDGRRPSDVLHELFQQLTPRDQELLGYSLFLGLVMRNDESSYSQGDFLVRSVYGIDPKTGALAVGAAPRAQQVVQFHLRDAAASGDDLRAHLSAYRTRRPGVEPSGSLLFSCLGRGVSLYGQPDHDSRELRSALGEVPIGGFFCGGEIGPVGGTTYLHGYTSVIALFRSG